MYNSGFKDRAISYISTEEMGRLRSLSVLDESAITQTDDWIVVCTEGADEKYGRLMYSKKLDRLRAKTIGEFYGTGIVD